MNFARSGAGRPAPRSGDASRALPPRWSWLALGASTGGPASLHELLRALPVPLPLRVLVVQHIAPGFEPALVDWLRSSLAIDARLAVDGELPLAGSVCLAPAAAHLRVDREGRLRLDAVSPPRNGHRPSIDELFCSLAEVAPRETAAALLTGMGRDGAEGLLALRSAGAFCLAQSEASSAVFAMPRAALELGAAEQALSPRQLGLELARRIAAAC